METRTAPTVHEATSANFDQLARGTDTIAVVDFWAPWCGWCRKFAPVYEAAAPHFPDIKFVKVNVQDQREVGERFGIMSLPTIKFFCAGREIGEVVGAMSPEQFASELKQIQSHAQECLASSSAVPA